MTDYNDGLWHGWNGGECPVHPESVVEVAHMVSGLVYGENAEQFYWDTENCKIVAFRVIKAYKEPREWWALWAPAGCLMGYWASKEAAEKINEADCKGMGEVIHVREVLE